MRRACAGALILCIGVLGCPLPGPDDQDTAGISLQLVASGLNSPIAFAMPHDATGRMFVADQIGIIYLIDAAGTRQSAPFLDLRDRLVTLTPQYDERGLLGLAFHPAFSSNGRFYVYYSAPPGDDLPDDFDSETRLSEFRLIAGDPNRADPASERILLRIGQPQFNHNGGQLAFGADGYLYAGIGDGGAANDVGLGHTPGLGNAQDLSTLLGKILRIDVDAGDPYAVPADNPFVGVAGARPEIWAYGFRNPWRFSFDLSSEGVERLFVGDVGQDLFEEVDIAVRGGNYGWNIREGLHCFNPVESTMPPAACATVGASGEALLPPILEYPHTDGLTQVGISVTGGFVYRGSAIPALRGQYVFGDFTRDFTILTGNGSLFAAREDAPGQWSRRDLAVNTASGRIGRFLLSFGQDHSGELYVLARSNASPDGETGVVYKLVPSD